MSSEDSSMLLPLSASQQEAMEDAVATYEAALTPAIAGVLSARGIDRSAAAMFRLGVVRDPHPGHERYLGWIVIPYLDKDGVALSMRFRCPEEHDHRSFGHGKYMSMTDEPSRVFNVRAIHQQARAREGIISITEGEFDAMVLCKVDIPAVAIPGAMGWNANLRPMFAGFNRIYLWGDPDDAGAEFNRKVNRSLPQSKAVRLRGGDVTDIYKAGGARALRELIQGDNA